MLLRTIRDEDKAHYNQVVQHPLQSWEWGEFRQKTGVTVERLGFFENGVLRQGLQATFHPIPVLGGTVGYIPKGFTPDSDQFAALQQLAVRNRAVSIKLEPDVSLPVALTPTEPTTDFAPLQAVLKNNAAVAGRPLFTRYTFVLDLTPTEETLFQNLDQKTRYNVNLSAKKGVTIVEASTAAGLETYLEVLQETTSRQAFYAHSPEYFRQMWATLAPSGMMRIFHARFGDETLVAWIMFVFHKTLYYPYGASRSTHRNLMASNLMLWEMIRFGKEQGCTSFDMWGSLGPDANERDPWYGFHKFKKGYGGVLTEFIGTYDVVYQPTKYKVFTIANNLRWQALRIKKMLPF